MTSKFLVGPDVAGDTQQLDVADIIGQLLHRFRIVGVGRLDGNLMVAVNTGADESLAAAPLTKSASPLPYDALHLGPALAVQ